MKRSISLLRNSLVTAASLFAVLSSTHVSAAPVVYESSPLFLSNKAEPNMFFVMDDSGSMDTDMMSPFESVSGWGGVMTISQGGNSFFYLYLAGAGTNLASYTLDNQNQNYYVIPHFSGVFAAADNFVSAPASRVYTTPSNSLRGIWRARNYQYNPLYYNPNVDYAPWAGVDNNGSTYRDIDVSGFGSGSVLAPYDPFRPTNTFNLASNQRYVAYLRRATDIATTTPYANPAGVNFVEYDYYPAFYNVWNDTNSNGLIDSTDTFRRIEIRPGTTVCSGTGDDADQFSNGCIRRTPADEMKNFANWFAYHRKRKSVAKYGVSQVVNTSSNLRMGYTTINMRYSTGTNVSVRLNTMNADAANGNKRTLLDNLFSTRFNQGTPLFRGIQLTGEYFDCTNNGTTAFASNDSQCAIQQTPIAPATEAAGICQQNYMVLVTDGEYTDSSPINIDNEDADTGAGAATNTLFDGPPYGDTLNDTLADLTMHFYEKDLSAQANRVPIECGVDENSAQHMVSFILGFGVQGNLDPTTFVQPSGIDPSCPATTVTTPAWPTSISTFADRIDDVAHSSYNGRGQYLSAQNPKQLTDGLNKVLSAVLKRTGSATSVTFNSSSLNSGTIVFFASFDSSTWDGKLSAYNIDSSGNLDLSSPAWPSPAEDQLEAASASSRTIMTFNDDPANYGAIPFRTFASLTTTQQNDLSTDQNDNIVADPTTAQARLDFIRGDHTCETDWVPATDCGLTAPIFRSRVYDPITKARFKLGDIVHSSPVYVGSPPNLYPSTDPFGIDGKRFRDYRNGVASASLAFSSGKTAKDRTPMVYVGANDGMLHAFNALTGEEIWAYIPNALFQTDDQIGPGLHSLTEIDYPHEYYVDLPPTVTDAYIDTGSGPEWHSILVGGLRSGGRGLFAIDVTDPDLIISSPTRETELKNKIMWEFTSNDDKDFGLSFSEARIVPMGSASGGIDWYVIIGNGYNSLSGNKDIPIAEESTKPKNVSGASSNPYSSKLFILKLSGPGSDGTWDHGTDYWKIDTKLPAGNTWTEADRNGLSTAAVADYDGDSIADLVYAGDLYGRMWAFDIMGTNTNSWGIYGGNSPNPLFIAKDNLGNRQPITSAPALAFNEDVPTVTSSPGINVPNLLIYFGTGSYVKPTDTSDVSAQSFYAVWDTGESNIPSGGYTVNRSSPGSSDLVRQPINTDIAADGSVSRIINPAQTVDYTSGSTFGWYLDLPDTGERVSLSPVVLSSIVFIKTLIPSPNPCDFGGYSWNMNLDASTGQAPDSSLIDFDNSGDIGAGDLTQNGHVSAGTREDSLITNSALTNAGSGIGGPLNCPEGYDKKAEFITLSDGTTKTNFICVPENQKTGRLSWKELRF